MAGDWIKFEKATSDKPEVWAVAERLDLDPDAVVGKLLRVWAWFDDHTENGNAPSVTKKLLDREVGVAGFCDCVIESGWMVEVDGGVSLPNFDRHNGETSKKRALSAKRAAKHREKSNAESNAGGVTSALPREEKRREEKKTKQSRAVALPDDMQPTDGHKALADRLGVTLITEFEKFCDHHRAKGSTFKDWNAALNNWLRNAAKFQAERNPAPQSGGAPRLKEFRP